ncbi:hypothetical protein CU098_005346, partial [Rhizopus stolonifer]
MTSRFEKYTVKSFCPLILYHDNPSEQLSLKLSEDKQHTAIDRHREKITEMLEHNAQFWTEKTGLVEFEADYLDKDIKVSPSTSTTSNISSSSSSSGDSIATIDHSTYHTKYMVRSPMTETQGHYYSLTEEEQTKTPLQRKQATRSTKPLMNDTTKKRRRGNLPKEVTEFLRKWLIQHKKHPYPAEKEKADLARHTGLTVNQISNWFINARRRILQPMLESENLTAQMMAYPELMQNHHEPARRRRHDFYTYQREFVHSL